MARMILRRRHGLARLVRLVCCAWEPHLASSSSGAGAVPPWKMGPATFTRSFATSQRPSQAGHQYSLQANPIIQTLTDRNLISSVSSSHISSHLSTQPRTIYLGIDPTAPSLHIGNLVPIVALLWLVKAGHRGILLIGGATGSIGDPSGKNSERADLGQDVLKANIRALNAQLEAILDLIGKRFAREEPEANRDESVKSSGQSNGLDVRILNNETFYEGLGVLSFLRDVGRYVRIGDVLARDSVKTRLPPPVGTSTTPNAGLSYTEFSYQLLQAYDYYILNSMPDVECTVQLGGSDQMGNISAGVELIRRKRFGGAKGEPQSGEADDTAAFDEPLDLATPSTRRLPPAYGLTLPLLTTSSGAKLGKSAGNAIFLSPQLCSDYDFYQYLIRSTDEDVEKLLKCLTFLPREAIEADTPTKGAKQLLLADEVTSLFRGSDALVRAKKMTTLLHNTLATCKGPEELQNVVDASENIWKELHLMAVSSSGREDAKVLRFRKSEVVGKKIIDVLIMAGLARSKSQARQLVASGAYLNNTALGKDDTDLILTEDHAASFPTSPGDMIMLLRKGKRTAKVILLEAHD